MKTKVGLKQCHCWVLAWGCGAGHYFEFLIHIFPLLVSTAKFIGEVYNNRRSAVNQCPGFAYPFVFLMLRQYCWHCDLYSANRTKRGEYEKSSKILLLALLKRPASPKGAASAHRFAYKHRAHRSANNISFVCHVVPILLALSHSYRFTYCFRTHL